MPTLTINLDQAYVDLADSMAVAAGAANGRELIVKGITSYLLGQYPTVVPASVVESATALANAREAFLTALTTALNITIDP